MGNIFNLSNKSKRHKSKMAKFCEYRDLFKWNKQIMEDDWNDGQTYVLKTTSKCGDAELTNTAKVADQKNDAHKVALEHKTKFVNKEVLNGLETEFKLKNSGEVAYECKSDYLKQFEGFENVRLLGKGALNKNQIPLTAGVSFMNNSVKFDWYNDLSKDYGATMNYTYRATDWMILGVTKSWKSVLSPMNNVKWGVGVASHFDKTLHFGVLVKGNSPALDTTAVNDATMYFHKDSGDQSVGAEMKYTIAKKAFDTKVGLALKQGDHTWKLRLHDSGMARAALQWQLHKVCKVTADTSIDVKQALGGSITSLPLGFTFDVKY